MPAGQPWRTGADEATVLVTDKALKFGTYSLPAGTYTINTEPGDKGWQLIFGKLSKPGQWGVPYQKDLEIGRTPMTVGKTKAPVESMTIHIDDTPAGATLRIEWGGSERDGAVYCRLVARQSAVVSRESQSSISVVSPSRQSRSSVGSPRWLPTTAADWRPRLQTAARARSRLTEDWD